MSNFKATIYGFDYYLDGGLFRDLTLPEGIDKDVLIDTILMECGEMQPVFTDAEFMQKMIGSWGKKYEWTFEKWIRAMDIEYDPLYNYDRHEEWDNTTTLNNKSEATTKKSSYDSATLTPYDKVEGTDDNNGHEIRKGHLYGNIGVTTSQQMLESEFKVAEWNIYEHIKDLFMQTFCVMIY